MMIVTKNLSMKLRIRINYHVKTNNKLFQMKIFMLIKFYLKISNQIRNNMIKQRLLNNS